MSKSIRGGMSACAGMSGGHWYGGALVLPAGDEAFLEISKDWPYEERVAHSRTWCEMTLNPARRLVSLCPDGDGMKSTLIRAAERIEGPVCPREETETPVLVWTERRESQWHLMCWQGGSPVSILARPQTLRCPRVALTEAGLLFAFEIDTGPHTTAVQLVDQQGLTCYTAPGRRPLLVAAKSGFVLGTEEVSTNRVMTRLSYFARAGSSAPDATVALEEGDYCFNGDIAWTGKTLVSATESCPALGQSNQIGLYRTIHTWQWDLSSEPCALGQLPVEERAFKSIGAENITPIQPAILLEDGEPVILFRQHRFTGFRGFGWDLFRCRREGDGWSTPERISPDTMTADSTFGLVKTSKGQVGLFPAHENVGGNGSQQSSNHRVDLVRVGKGLERFEIPEDKKADSRVPPSCKDIALEPAPLASPYEGRQLIWGDLHIHSTYSKCVSAVDCDPRDNIRYAREVLGCRVFAIAEHTPHTTGVESTWLYDQLESTAGDENVVLYATEPGIKGTRHMNLYSRDRSTFEKLERILLSQDRSYPETLRQMREDLPHDSVFVMRHVHGNAIPDDQIPQHFDPHFEVAMEAMQGRGNAMLGEFEGSSVFPTPFLNAGCKVGLVGGTDHFREWAPNHFCLTGFWVKEVSPDGVWEAIRNRHTIAMSNGRVAMLTRAKGNPMGSTVSLEQDENFTLDLQVSCAHPVRRVCLIRDGELLPWVEVGAKTATLQLKDDAVPGGCHWYVATAEFDTGYGDTGICHASPTFVWKNRE